MIDPTEIKDVPCSTCGEFTPEDELHNIDWDWGICSLCKDNQKDEDWQWKDYYTTYILYDKL